MEINGKTLILDNFRSVLSEYSVDIQDVMRSAILDGIDITGYLKDCKSNPYRLEQIRLGIKENIDSDFFKIKNGTCLYKLRNLIQSNNSAIVKNKKKILDNARNDDNLEILLNWILKNYDIENIDISVIPRNLIGVFEDGLSKGVDMSVFNNGKSFSFDYIKYCIAIKNNDKDISIFVKDNTWSENVLILLSIFSSVDSSAKWNNLISSISSDTPYEKVSSMIECVKNNINVSQFKSSDWTGSAISIILSANMHGLDINELIEKSGSSINRLEDTYNNMLKTETQKKLLSNRSLPRLQKQE